MTARTREEELEMMRDPSRWTHATVLPLVRRSKTSATAWPETGFLYQPSMRLSCPPEPVVYLGNIYGLKGKRVSELEKKTYGSLEAIAADGWEVD